MIPGLFEFEAVLRTCSRRSRTTCIHEAAILWTVRFMPIQSFLKANWFKHVFIVLTVTRSLSTGVRTNSRSKTYIFSDYSDPWNCLTRRDVKYVTTAAIGSQSFHLPTTDSSTDRRTIISRCSAIRCSKRLATLNTGK